MRHKIIAVLLFASVLLVLVKLFTVELRYQDDPSVALAVRGTPDNSNTVTLSSGQQFSDYMVLLVDENGYPGMGAYKIITAWLWWLVPLASLVGFVVLGHKHKS